MEKLTRTLASACAMNLFKPSIRRINISTETDLFSKQTYNQTRQAKINLFFDQAKSQTISKHTESSHRFYFSQEKGGFKNLWKRKCEDIFLKTIVVRTTILIPPMISL